MVFNPERVGEDRKWSGGGASVSRVSAGHAIGARRSLHEGVDTRPALGGASARPAGILACVEPDGCSHVAGEVPIAERGSGGGAVTPAPAGMAAGAHRPLPPGGGVVQ